MTTARAIPHTNSLFITVHHGKSFPRVKEEQEPSLSNQSFDSERGFPGGQEAENLLKIGSIPRIPFTRGLEHRGICTIFIFFLWQVDTLVFCRIAQHTHGVFATFSPGDFLLHQFAIENDSLISGAQMLDRAVGDLT